MNKKVNKIEFLEYDHLQDGLASSWVRLFKMAKDNLIKSYAPYSLFKVSSVVQLANGELIMGTNQENVAYPSGICAERVAVFSAKSLFPDQDIEQIVLVTEQSNPFPFSPCGACRQVLMEYETMQKKPIRIGLKSGDSSIWIFSSVRDLLPFTFDAKNMLKKG